MLDLDNPLHWTWAVTAALMALKVMGQGWMTVHRMMKVKRGFASPEDARAGAINPDPVPGQLEPDEYVDRSRRMHRNDLENIPAFWVAGLVFVATSPPLWAAQVLMWGFVVARAGHAWAYATAQGHETRATFYTLGSVAVIVMAFWALAALLF